MNASHAAPVGGTLPNRSTASCTCDRKSSSVVATGAVPMTRKSRGISPATAELEEAGSSLRAARSPVAPKRTMT